MADFDMYSIHKFAKIRLLRQISMVRNAADILEKNLSSFKANHSPILSFLAWLATWPADELRGASATIRSLLRATRVLGVRNDAGLSDLLQASD